MIYCTNCHVDITNAETTGESGVYSPNRAFLLCEPCFLEEDAEIERAGTNDLPHRITHYMRKVK